MLPHSPTTQRERTSPPSIAWAYRMQDHPYPEAPPALTSQDVTRASHTSNILQARGGGQRKGVKALYLSWGGLGLKPRGCASTPLQKPPCHTSNLFNQKDRMTMFEDSGVFSISAHLSHLNEAKKGWSRRVTLRTVACYAGCWWMAEWWKETAVQRKA